MSSADSTLFRTAKAGEDDKDTIGNASVAYSAVGQLTLTSVKSFVLEGDHATEAQGYFHTGSTTGRTVGGGTAQLSTVASLSLDTQEHATAAIATIDGAIAKLDGQRADLGAISNRLSHVCLLYTSPSPRDGLLSRMPSSA